jgi:single-strand DNA-binding protein
MNIVVLQGRLSSAPVVRPLASGSILLSLELTTTVDGAAASVPVAWLDPPASVAWEAGDELVVTGTVRRRFFRSAGFTQSRTEVVATQVIEAAKRRQVRNAIAKALAAAQPEAG